MSKVVTNLVLNAKQAVSGKGRVCIENTHRNGWVVLAVADNGCGMSAEFQQRSLFRPFQTTKKKGLGIGVFQSKMIVEAHGGQDRGRKRTGQGHNVSRIVARPKARSMNPKLLIVDDDEEIRTQMKWALAQDYEVLLAEDRASAIELFQFDRPSVVLMDLGLPPTQTIPTRGWRRCPSCRAGSIGQGRGHHGTREKEVALNAVGAGAYDFLCKPVDIEELRLLLKRCFHVARLEREYPRDAAATSG